MPTLATWLTQPPSNTPSCKLLPIKCHISPRKKIINDAVVQNLFSHFLLPTTTWMNCSSCTMAMGSLRLPDRSTADVRYFLHHSSREERFRWLFHPPPSTELVFSEVTVVGHWKRPSDCCLSGSVEELEKKKKEKKCHTPRRAITRSSSVNPVCAPEVVHSKRR